MPSQPKPPKSNPLNPTTGQPPGKQGGLVSNLPKASSPRIPKPPAKEDSTEYNKTKTTKRMPFIGKFKGGGKVKKTGVALVHKGEKVLTAKQTKKASRKRYARKG